MKTIITITLTLINLCVVAGSTSEFDRLLPKFINSLRRFEGESKRVVVSKKVYYVVYQDRIHPELKTVGVGINISERHNCENLYKASQYTPNITLGVSKVPITGVTNLNEFVDEICFVSKSYSDDLLILNAQLAWDICSNLNVDIEGQPDEVKLIVWDMAYNMGETRLLKFVKFRKALLRRDYVSAANEMMDSRWYHQVGRRGRSLVSRMKRVN